MISPYPHLIDLNDYPVSWWKQVVDLGEQIKNHPEIYAGACSNKIMATLFYEPSTRTQMSFQSAMLRLGGRLIGFDNPANSSVSKAALSADCPVINAGDSGHLHPTQTLTDLLTLQCEKGRLDHLTIGLCGDLINGRTVHSLIEALVRYTGIKIVLISPEELRLPDYIRDDVLRANNVPFEEVIKMEDVLPKLDVLYMTRVQKERFFNEDDYIRMKDFYILDQSKMDLASPEMLVLHPLPRVNEISVDVDNDPRAAYFKQVQYGVYARMALILTLLNIKVD